LQVDRPAELLRGASDKEIEPDYNNLKGLAGGDLRVYIVGVL